MKLDHYSCFAVNGDGVTLEYVVGATSFHAAEQEFNRIKTDTEELVKIELAWYDQKGRKFVERLNKQTEIIAPEVAS